MSRVHVVGGGLAGLAAALRCADAGHDVTIYEAAAQLGGRCRSFFDPGLDRTIDNGAHVLIGANRHALAFLARLGTDARLQAVSRVPMADVATGEHWTVRLDSGPAGCLRPEHVLGVPGARPIESLALLRLATAGSRATVAALCWTDDALYRRFLRPLALAALNTPPETGTAALLGAVLRRSLLGGRSAAAILVAPDGLSATFVAPAERALAAAGAQIRLAQRLRALETRAGGCVALDFGGRQVTVGRDERVILAVPPAAARALLPDLTVPDGSHAIVNVHYRLDRPATLAGGASVLGVVGGTAEWLFARGDVLTVTVSAADRLLDRPAERLAGTIWAETRSLLQDPPENPLAWRCLKERRATFAQTPANLRRRPGVRTPIANLFLAGDWTATGLPATIEGSVLSGVRAAALAVGRTRAATFKTGAPALSPRS